MSYTPKRTLQRALENFNGEPCLSLKRPCNMRQRRTVLQLRKKKRIFLAVHYGICWSRVIEHSRAHPIDAGYLDGHWEETPLYLACQQDPPPEAIRAISEAYPEAVLLKSRANKDLPLHIACRYQATASVLETLLRDFPGTATWQTKFGALPLNALWEFKPVGAEADDTFWTKVRIILSSVAIFRNIESGLDNPGPHDLVAEDRAGGELFLLHAAVSLGGLSCPMEVLKYILERYPNQVHERDRSGQLPLHIAVGPTSWSQTTRRKYKPREREFISLLLDAYPNAATKKLPLNGGRHPLHIALTNRHTWTGGVRELLQAAPEVLFIPDPVTKLFPFQLASIRVRDTEVDLGTIYNLLRRQPDVLGFFKVGKKTKQKWVPDIFSPLEFCKVYYATTIAVVAAGLILNLFWISPT
eukprot:scaffold20791_cov137-Cylindrotheca_fusiformis.AAC.1